MITYSAEGKERSKWIIEAMKPQCYDLINSLSMLPPLEFSKYPQRNFLKK
jgi:hypothetical protein